MLLVVSLLAAACLVPLTPLRRVIPSETVLGFLATAGLLSMLYLADRLA